MSKNLIKGNYQSSQEEKPCVIDNNELIARRIEQVRAILRMQDGGEDTEGDLPGEMIEGLEAEQVASLLADGENGEAAAPKNNVIKSNSAEEAANAKKKALEEAQAQADQIISQAQAQAQEILQKAASDAEQLRSETVTKAHDEGYQKGMELGEKKIAEQENILRQREQALKQKEQQLIAEYDQRFEDMEPRFVETIAGIYEHIFHVDFKDYKNVIVYLIENTMRKIEGNRNFLIHVSREDYPLVSMQKKEIQSYAAGAASIEIIEDMTLGKNECLIETEGGIFDCGLGTQLEELGKEIRLLSYEGN